MTYKGYEITAEVQSYDIWTVGENGEANDWQESLDGIEITGYHFTKRNAEDGTVIDSYFDEMSESDADELKQSIDMHIEELGKVKA